MLCLASISVVHSRLQETALVLEMELRDWAGKPGRIFGRAWVWMDVVKARGGVIGISKNFPQISRFFMMVYILKGA